ncbi:MAG TPA: LacI family DNA-binding transcriptional regulator [Terriglobia bacterium]|nr:LacI family DNA-binding transcriptional regulator [Terriglobia bacterium]
MRTIRDVARLAGVSTATVSFVINEKAHVSDELKRRVLDAIDALNYRPNNVARSLKVRRTQTIGMVVPQITNPFFGEIMTGVEFEAHKSGYSVIFCNSNEDPALETLHLNILFERRVDGILLSSSNPLHMGDRRSTRRSPVVFVDRTPPGYLGAAVVGDNLGASREAARHLIGLGHSRIAIITGPLNLPICVERLEGFRQALQEAVLPLADDFVKCGDFRSESGYLTGLELMRLPDPPTAIFCSNNTMTLGLMRALGQLGISCPEQVSVLAFDDFEWAASFRPQITAVAQPTREMGRLATEILIKEIEADKAEAGSEKKQTVVLANELRVRDSTAPPNRSLLMLSST